MDSYVDLLWTLLGSVKTAVEAEFALQNVAMPTRRYRGLGEIAFDGEQVTVALAGLYGIPTNSATSGVPTQAIEAMRCTSWRGCEIEVVVMRCAPSDVTDNAGNIKPPSIEAIEAAAKDAARDAQIVSRGLTRALRAGSFGESPNFALGQWKPLGPQGGLVGGVTSAFIGLVL